MNREQLYKGIVEEDDLSFTPLQHIDILYFPEKKVYVGNVEIFEMKRPFTESEKEQIIRRIKSSQKNKGKSLLKHLLKEISNSPEGFPKNMRKTEKGAFEINIEKKDYGIIYKTERIKIDVDSYFIRIQPKKFFNSVETEIGKKYIRFVNLKIDKIEGLLVDEYDIIDLPKPYRLARDVVPYEMLANVLIFPRFIYHDSLYVTGKIIKR
ncbi:hypothetical protein J4408_00730 [Candidatus Pacearchaeota archaeon]|nr:hypothetical protein [Candidatus Pacearchaeota archaeon]